MKKSERIDHICRTVLLLTTEVGWNKVSLPYVAEASDVPFGDVFKIAPSKVDLLKLLLAWFDDRLLSSLDFDANEESSRDRLFDIMMQRFDVMEPYRTALTSIAESLRRDASPLIALRKQGLASVRLMMEAAGLNSSGLTGALQLRALTAVWLAAFNVWLNDDDPGLAKTMSVLDRRLRQWQQFFNRAHSKLNKRGC